MPHTDKELDEIIHLILRTERLHEVGQITTGSFRSNIEQAKQAITDLIVKARMDEIHRKIALTVEGLASPDYDRERYSELKSQLGESK